MSIRTRHVVVVGAGIGGLVAALELARSGLRVTVVERQAAPGGKMRRLFPGGRPVDAGPTVLTMRWIFEEIFDDAGAALGRLVPMRPAEILARHAWSAEERLDLFADPERTVQAIADFAGPDEAVRYRRFAAHAREVFETLDRPFMQAARPTQTSLVRATGIAGIGRLVRMRPFASLWQELGRHFRDPRLRQLFARYATYCGASPFEAPATLALIAHVELAGVWLVEGGMHRLAAALAQLAAGHGARLRYGTGVASIAARGGRVAAVRLDDGEEIAAEAVIFNGDAAAAAAGLVGDAAANAVPQPTGVRSLSAITWAMDAPTEGFPLLRHTVFFARDYRAEFDAIFCRAELPAVPTVYVCAQDRGDRDGPAPDGPERLLCLVNAPATGDTRKFDPTEIGRCEEEAFSLMRRCGLGIAARPGSTIVTTPAGFGALFPATGGALYGRATHGAMAAFRRPGARTRLPGLYLAGGSVHPGAGVPMAALSGRSAARQLLQDFASIRRFPGTATAGGTSTR